MIDLIETAPPEFFEGYKACEEDMEDELQRLRRIEKAARKFTALPLNSPAFGYHGLWLALKSSLEET